MKTCLDSICGSGSKSLALSRSVSVADAVIPSLGKGDVATNPKPSCVFRGQFPCQSVHNPLHWQFSVSASKTKAVVLISYVEGIGHRIREFMIGDTLLRTRTGGCEQKV